MKLFDSNIIIYAAKDDFVYTSAIIFARSTNFGYFKS